MRRSTITIALSALFMMALGSSVATAACCYFAAKDKDVLQPAQKAFITWNASEKVESFTVQPKFEGNADDFGMVVPSPSKPRLDEMPRDFFKELAVFTILEPMDLTKYKQQRLYFGGRGGGAFPRAAAGAARPAVRVLEAGIVGSLDYKIIQADKADDLFDWLKENKYNYAGDQPTLDYYIKKGWFFTVMKIDPKQMKRKPDGSYEGDVTPTRFQFTSDKLVYPMRLTRISVKDKTEAIFYVQSDHKMDLPGDLSYQNSFTPMWSQATGFALPDKLTDQEKMWQGHVKEMVPKMLENVNAMRKTGKQPATLEWAKKLTAGDMDVLMGEKKYNRDAPAEDVAKLKILKGHLKQGQFITKFRKVFTKDEMGDDIEFVRARIGDKDDDMEYFSILPTSPP